MFINQRLGTILVSFLILNPINIEEIITMAMTQGVLGIIIWDHGKEWNGLVMPRELAEKSLDTLNDELASTGRGVPIISRIASQISRQRYCELNESIFIIPHNSVR